jgi:hypothetical protein
MRHAARSSSERITSLVVRPEMAPAGAVSKDERRACAYVILNSSRMQIARDERAAVLACVAIFISAADHSTLMPALLMRLLQRAISVLT